MVSSDNADEYGLQNVNFSNGAPPNPVLEEQLTSSQYCSVPGKSILEAVSVLRDVVAYAELTLTPICILSLDFRNAFDRISHLYLFQILAGYGVSACLIKRVPSMYEHATASL